MIGGTGPSGPENVRPACHGSSPRSPGPGTRRRRSAPPRRGTNGKGSAASFACDVLRRLPLGPIGLYTSPHLVAPEERIRIDGEMISSRALRDGFRVADRPLSCRGPADLVREDDMVRLRLVPAQGSPDRRHGDGTRGAMGRDQRVPPGGIGHYDRRIRPPGVARKHAWVDRRGKGGDPSQRRPARHRTVAACRPRCRPAARPAARVRRLGTWPHLRLEGASGRNDLRVVPRV